MAPTMIIKSRVVADAVGLDPKIGHGREGGHPSALGFVHILKTSEPLPLCGVRNDTLWNGRLAWVAALAAMTVLRSGHTLQAPPRAPDGYNP